MTDIHDLRAQMREGRGVRPVVVHGGGFKLPFGLMAGGAVVIGFLVVLFTPKIYSVQRTAALPAFKEARQEAPAPVAVAAAPQPVAAAQPVAVAAQPVAAKSGYAGKSADEAARIADAVCEQRLIAAPQRGQAAVEAKLHCFLSEGTARFCTGGQARKATADIINYFKGIEYTNTAMVGGGEDAGAVPLAVGGYEPAADPADAGSARGRSDRRPDARRLPEPGPPRGHRRERAARLQGALRAHRRHQVAVPGAALVGGVEIAIRTSSRAPLRSA